ncbi:hypothetical protein [Microbacterium sp. cx-59]|uniref:hypothetical protein n=1 Tax=Microbacterium sp. cx-59 TaxID=2891207 RepID=UPI001E41284F|nr:hypothetical protein [Microbacterium sp. cx-59]MCC4909396.1 hypothetical protein [Microbacterium sp. cx-59]
MSVRPHTKWSLSVGIGVIGALIVTLVVLAFLWPSKTAGAHDVPLGIVGSADAVAAFEDALDASAPGVFDLTEASDRDAAVAQIEERHTYGAIVLNEAPNAPEVLTAPAASTAVSQQLGGLAAQLQAQLSAQVAAAGGDADAVTVAVTPIVPLSADDPNGTGLTAAAFPLTMGGMIGGIVISLLVVGVIRRLVALGGFAVASGLILSLVLHTWFGFVPGDYATIALVIGISVLGTSALIVGFTALIGTPGVAVGAILTMLVGNPISGAALPWQFLAQPWGAIGQYFVPGASSTLLRSVAYFPAADTSAQWLTLAAWAAGGILLALAGHFRSRAAIRVPASTLEAEAPAPA